MSGLGEVPLSRAYWSAYGRSCSVYKGVSDVSFYKDRFFLSSTVLSPWVLRVEGGSVKRARSRQQTYAVRVVSQYDEFIHLPFSLHHEQFMAAIRAKVMSVEVTKARPLAYVNFIGRRVAETAFCGCTFIKASAEYRGKEAQPTGSQRRTRKIVRPLVCTRCTRMLVLTPQLIFPVRCFSSAKV